MLHTSFVIFGLLYAIDLAKIFNRHYPMHEPQRYTLQSILRLLLRTRFVTHPARAVSSSSSR